MLKALTVTTAAAALMIGAAAAQGTGPSPAPAKPPAASPSKPAPAAKSSEMSKPAATAQSAKFISAQQSSQYLASSFKGTDVLGADGKKIGDVSDILFDKDGKVLAYVVSVGGFLGIGSKDVALEPGAFQVIAGDRSKHQSDKLKLSMTEDQIKQAANFRPYQAPASTTGMGSSSPGRPAPGGMPR